MDNIDQILDESESKVIKELTDIKKNIEAKSELTHEQVVEICRLKHIAKKYKISAMNSFITDFMQLMISKKRKGREEFIQALQNNAESMRQPIFGNMRQDRI